MSKFVEYQRPCRTTVVRDDFKDHVARGSVLPGTDYGCNTGDKVFAAANGTVIEVDNAPVDARGISLKLHHSDGNTTHYLHLSRILVRKGQRVKRGDLIAYSGNTGTTSTGAHLHFAIQDDDGKCFDYTPFLAKNQKQANKRDASVLTVLQPTHMPD